jgi:outer membrane protein assembly factor BamE
MHYFLKLLFVLFVVSCALLTGCGSTVPMVKPFKMDIQQGNVVTSKMLLQLRPGMSKSQVKFVMGTPLIVDSFHGNRWDYFYQLRQGGKIIEQRRVILDFEKDLLARVRGDVVPQGTAGAEPSTETNVATSKSIEAKPKEEGLLDKLKFWKSDEKAAVKPEAAKLKEEKGWLDKLKFWKKDEPKAVAKEVVPEIKQETSQEAISGDAMQTNADAPSGDAPSILAVPIGDVAPSVPEATAPNVSVPEVSTPEATAPIVSTPVVEEPKTEMLKVEPAVVETPAAEPVAPTMPEPPPVPVVEQAAPEVAKPVMMNQDEPFIFRMDKNLDLRNLDKKIEAPIEVAPPAETKVKPKKAQEKIDEPLPPETEPSYFERMLEKIGF